MSKFKDLVSMFERMSLKMVIDSLKSSVLFMYVNGIMVQMGDIDLVDDEDFIAYAQRCMNREKKVVFKISVLGETYEINSIERLQSLSFYKDWIG